MSDQGNTPSTSRITRPLSDSEIPPAQDPALPTNTPAVKGPLRTRIWNKLKLESNALEALAALVAMLAVLWGVGSYVGEEPQRRQAAHNSAWQLSNSATGQKASGGRIEALQELNKDAISLAGLVASGANLQVIKLPKANLLEADLQGANLAYADLQGASLAFANLRDVDLGFANLEDANLRGAHLLGAKLQNANLQHAVLRGADLESANLKSAILDHADFTGSDVAYADFRDSKNLTASQVRLARNWELALFDAQLKEELGLNP